jgi:hypothetical protein
MPSSSALFAMVGGGAVVTLTCTPAGPPRHLLDCRLAHLPAAGAGAWPGPRPAVTVCTASDAGAAAGAAAGTAVRGTACWAAGTRSGDLATAARAGGRSGCRCVRDRREGVSGFEQSPDPSAPPSAPRAADDPGPAAAASRRCRAACAAVAGPRGTAFLLQPPATPRRCAGLGSRGPACNRTGASCTTRS